MHGDYRSNEERARFDNAAAHESRTGNGAQNYCGHDVAYGKWCDDATGVSSEPSSTSEQRDG